MLALADTFLEEAVSPVDEITDACEFYPNDIEPVCDAIVECGNAVAISLHNRLDESIRAYEVLMRVNGLPASDSKLQKIQEGIEIIQQAALVQEAVEFERASDWDNAAAKYREALSLCDPDEGGPLTERLAHSERMARLGGEVKPAGSDIYLQTWNGLGCKFYGCTDEAADGSHVTTHWFVVLFVPIIALARYLVRAAPNGGWYIMGKLPLLPWQKYYSVAAVLLIAVALVGICASTDSGSSYSGTAPDTGYSEDYGSDSTAYQPPETSDSHISRIPAELERLRSAMDSADRQLQTWRSQLSSWRLEMDRIETNLESVISEKRSIERASERGGIVDVQRYDRLVSEGKSLVPTYNALQSQHNALVRRYNALLNERKSQRNQYNTLVDEYNASR